MALKITTTIIEQIEIECPMAQRGLAFNKAAGYQVLVSGPKIVGPGRADPNFFYLKAVKELPDA